MSVICKEKILKISLKKLRSARPYNLFILWFLATVIVQCVKNTGDPYQKSVDFAGHSTVLYIVINYQEQSLWL